MFLRTLLLCVYIGNSLRGFEARPSHENAFDKIAKIDSSYRETDIGKLKSGRDMIQLWPGGVIPFTVSQELQRQKGFLGILEGAMDEWQQKTCIQFKKRTSERNYVHFYRGRGCQSDVGVQYRGIQRVTLGKDCDTHEIIVHELGHTIGLNHEQNRPDRNKYIKVLWDNIMPLYHYAYRIKYDWHPESLKTPYDYYSVMHYGDQDFLRASDKGNVTMKAYNPQITMFGGSQVSGLDAMKVRKMYKCKDYPRFPQDFYWTHNDYGTRGLTCILINEPRDHRNSWNNNKLCYKSQGKRPLRIVWSNRGPVANMNCEKISYEKKSSQTGWNDNYLCLPKYAPFKFKWVNGLVRGPQRRNCLKINEPLDRNWNRGHHFLCATERETDRIDGKWLQWSEWSQCTLACGGGTQIRQRKCRQPANGGKFCVGADKQKRRCNTQPCQALPAFPKDFSFQHLPEGQIPSSGICLRTYDLYNYYDTRNYYFCTPQNKINPGIKWSPWGPIQGMTCTKINNPGEYLGWTNNYLCVPRGSPYRFKWSTKGPIPNMDCMRWFAENGERGWDTTYLCNKKQQAIYALQ